MASMSLQVDHDQFGTNLAGTLSKAMLTNPADVVAIERMKSQLMTDALERRRVREATSLLTQQTIDAAMENKRKNAAWNSLFPAAEAATDRTYDSLDQSPQVQATVATAPEPPAVVTDPAQTYAPPVPMLPNFYPPVADTSAPTPTVDATSAVATAKSEPDWTYRVNQYPLLSDDAPLPVDIPGLAVKEDRLGVPAALAKQDRLAPVMPDIARFGEPPAEVVIPEATGPVTASLDDRTRLPPNVQDLIYGPTEPADRTRLPSSLQDLMSGLSSTPDAELPAEIYTPAVPAVAEAPVAIEEPVVTPPPDQVITLPGRQLPEAPATDATVTAATAEPPLQPSPVSPTTPTVPVTPAAVEQAAATTAAATKGVDDGKGDTPQTVETKRGTVTRDEIKAEITAIYLNAKNPAEAQQAIQRLEGDLGITYDERVNVGPTGDPNATIAAYTRAAGGSALSKDAAAAQAGKSGTSRWEGTGIEAQDSDNITGMMSTMNNPQSVPTAEDAYDYAVSWGRQFGTPRMQRVEDEDGKFRDVPVPVHIPPGTPTPEEVYRRAGIPVPAGVPTSTTPAPATADSGQAAAATEAGAGGGTTAAEPAGAGASAGGGLVVEGDAKSGYIVKRPKKDPTKEMTDSEAAYTMATLGDQEITGLTAADMPTMAEYMASNPTKANKSILREAINMGFRYNNPKLAKYWGAIMTFSSPILRDEFGAATRPEDLDIVLERYAPQPNDSPEVIERKALRRKVISGVMAHSAFPGDTPHDRLMAADAYIVKTLGQEALLDDKYKSGAAPASTAPAADDDIGKMTDDQLRELAR